MSFALTGWDGWMCPLSIQHILIVFIRTHMVVMTFIPMVSPVCWSLPVMSWSRAERSVCAVLRSSWATRASENLNSSQSSITNLVDDEEERETENVQYKQPSTTTVVWYDSRKGVKTASEVHSLAALTDHCLAGQLQVFEPSPHKFPLLLNLL